MTTENQAPDPAQKWEGAEEWMPLAWELCANECGEEACTELIWEGGPIPEPWGDRWLKYEDQARGMIAMVRASLAAVQAPESALRAAAQRVLDDCIRISNGLDGGERHNGALAALRAALAAPAPQAAPCVVDGVLYSRSVVKRLAVQMGLVQEAPVALTRQQVKALMQEAGYDQAGPSARADFISGVKFAELAHGIPTPKEPTNGR
jgi:hypothetical protein